MRTSDASIPTMVEPKKIQSLLCSWEKRVSVSESSGCIPDVARLSLASPRSVPKSKVTTDTDSHASSNKSTKQTMEELGVFVSPREIQKKFIVPSKQVPKDSSEDCTSPTIEKEALLVFSPATTAASSNAKNLSAQPIDVPPVGSIRDRMKAFERNHDPDRDQAPWMAREFRGKRGSVLDRFTPQTAMKEKVLAKRSQNAQGLPMVSVFQPSDEINTDSTEPTDFRKSPDLHETAQDPVEVATTTATTTTAPTTTTSIKQVELEVPTHGIPPASPKNIKDVSKIDRDTLVLSEIRKMIQDTEDNEIEDEMDEDVKECLIQAALQSPAYTRRWYDALSDSWIHCPSLATIIMDFTLIEAAEVLYGDELPMLYTVSLRSVASEVMKEEEVLPEYIYRLAT